MQKDKGVVVSFRVDRHLADVLKKVPDKSSFIRDVILRSFYDTCPTCRGRGVVPKEIAKWSAARLKEAGVRQCQCCLYGYPAAARGAKPAKGRFVCRHCQDHDHSH
ncbi:MAG TPA: hypothetical protein VMV81_08360 [Phycisphaerae bacterium]|nr:hypothetical protein [Phycisphaerae bacterium]